MAINGFVRADETADEIEARTNFGASGLDVEVIAGEPVRTDGRVSSGSDDDIAPGVIEYVDYPAPVLSRAGSAAMVAARATGKGVGLSARHGWRVTRWFGHGARSAGYLGYRYVRGHDHQEVMGGRKNSAEWNRVENTKRARWRFLGWSVVGLGVVDLGSWIGLAAGADVPAGSWESWGAAPSAEAAIAVAALTLYGRYRVNNQLAPQEAVSPEDMDDNDEPFPLAWCRTGADVEDCVDRALAHEGIGTRQVRLLGSRPWGWEVDVTLKGSTPGKVGAVADQLDAHFDVKHGGAMVEPDRQRAAHLTMRLVTDDPFKNMPIPQVHAPNSLNVSDLHDYGLSMDGRPLEFVLEGTRIIVIGVSGSAKSTGVLRDLAEVITACHNAIAIEMDPIKDGLREFEGVMAAPAIRGSEACEQWLAWLVRMAEARNRVRNRLGMGDTWVATAKHPAVCPIVDEFIYLSKPAKESFIQLLRLGKQSGIYPICAGQDATSDSMGDAIADSFTLSIMLASRHADVPIVFGQGALAQGYRPDRLVPAQNAQITNDAGRSYIKGAGMDRPILYGWNAYSRDQITQAVQERQAAGRPWFDNDTLAEAGLLAELQQYRPSAAVSASMADLLEGLGSDEAKAFSVLVRAFEQPGASFLPTAELVATGAVSDAAGLQRLIAGRLPMAKSTKGVANGKEARGWDRKTIEDAANALFAPS